MDEETVEKEGLPPTAGKRGKKLNLCFDFDENMDKNSYLKNNNGQKLTIAYKEGGFDDLNRTDLSLGRHFYDLNLKNT